MYLHIGQNVMILKKNIVCIMDIENTTNSNITKKFLKNMQINGQIINVTNDLPKAFIVYKEKNITSVYITQFSSSTLIKRYSAAINEMT